MSMQEISYIHGERIAILASGTGWGSLVFSGFSFVAVVLTAILSLISLYLVWPRFYKEFKERGILNRIRVLENDRDEKVGK